MSASQARHVRVTPPVGSRQSTGRLQPLDRGRVRPYERRIAKTEGRIGAGAEPKCGQVRHEKKFADRQARIVIHRLSLHYYYARIRVRHRVRLLVNRVWHGLFDCGMPQSIPPRRRRARREGTEGPESPMTNDQRDPGIKRHGWISAAVAGALERSDGFGAGRGGLRSEPDQTGVCSLAYIIPELSGIASRWANYFLLFVCCVAIIRHIYLSRSTPTTPRARGEEGEEGLRVYERGGDFRVQRARSTAGISRNTGVRDACPARDDWPTRGRALPGRCRSSARLRCRRFDRARL